MNRFRVIPGGKQPACWTLKGRKPDMMLYLPDGSPACAIFGWPLADRPPEPSMDPDDPKRLLQEWENLDPLPPAKQAQECEPAPELHRKNHGSCRSTQGPRSPRRSRP